MPALTLPYFFFLLTIVDEWVRLATPCSFSVFFGESSEQTINPGSSLFTICREGNSRPVLACINKKREIPGRAGWMGGLAAGWVGWDGWDGWAGWAGWVGWVGSWLAPGCSNSPAHTRAELPTWAHTCIYFPVFHPYKKSASCGARPEGEKRASPRCIYIDCKEGKLG